MDKEIKLLIINPGSTSTKVSIFENGVEVHKKSLSHSAESLSVYKKATDQSEMRKIEIVKFLEEIQYDLSKLTAIVARGGSLPPIHTGAYLINEEMIDVLCNRPIGQHASSTAALIAHDLAVKLGVNAYIYDGNTADEMEDIARISGCPEIPRVSMGHILNTKAVGRMYAEKIGKPYEAMNLIIVHMGGGISIGLHKNGIISDILTDEEGTMAPERSGGLPSLGVARLCYSGKYTFEEISYMVRGKGGLTAYLGTNSVVEVENRIQGGDDYAKLVFDAMVYQTAKGIGSLAAAAGGKLDGIIFTGGIANSKRFTDGVKESVEFIHPVTIIAGEFEMEALAAGITRVIRGEEKARVYTEKMGE